MALNSCLKYNCTNINNVSKTFSIPHSDYYKAILENNRWLLIDVIAIDNQESA